ncbi:hypothetical protein LCGC14_0395050 [marine sediment metagenome]|uniref:Uncharacterized protein n=1 Tax=marine sediment metagenome TaxID=412755 RepID=A0A0F9SYB7_9ZZZZ
MTVTRYGVCPRCNLITYKKELTSVAETVESISYLVDKSCKCTSEDVNNKNLENR